MKKTYRVEIRRDRSGAWIARVPEVPGAHTYGRTIPQAADRMREALSLFVDDADRAGLDVHVALSASARRRVQSAVQARQRAEQAVRKAQDEVAHAVSLLVRSGLSARDAGWLLGGLSRQRIQQISNDRRSIHRRSRT
jgi:predicted RNase H-like HicB family nuclease